MTDQQFESIVQKLDGLQYTVWWTGAVVSLNLIYRAIFDVLNRRR